ncbi:unnamed protein product [Victoria cruziana]
MSAASFGCRVFMSSTVG